MTDPRIIELAKEHAPCWHCRAPAPAPGRYVSPPVECSACDLTGANPEAVEAIARLLMTAQTEILETVADRLKQERIGVSVALEIVDGIRDGIGKGTT